MNTKSPSTIIRDFAFKFCGKLEKTKNVVSSPLSAENLLALMTLGSTEPAHSELLAVLGFADDDAIRSTFSEATTKLKSIKGVTLNVANKVYVKEGPYDLHPELEEDAVKIFDAEIEKLDFNDSASAVNKMNTWVEKKTNDKITDLFSEESVNNETRIVLVNALYFKGSWQDRFDPSETKERPFHLKEHSTVLIPTMFKEDNYLYSNSQYLEAQLLEIPYLGNGASMLLVVPWAIEGLNNVLAKMAAGYDMMSDMEFMGTRKVYVTIPKFKIETEIDLKDLLPQLGVHSIFERRKSGLTKMLNNGEPLYVSKAVQKAFIEVNEEGTEAAAATGYCYRPMSRPPRCYADRPFLYMLLAADQVPLFIGVFRGVD